MKPVNGG